jgi:hypothetical protein
LDSGHAAFACTAAWRHKECQPPARGLPAWPCFARFAPAKPPAPKRPSPPLAGSDELSVELPLDEVMRVAGALGLRLGRHELVAAPYMGARPGGAWQWCCLLLRLHLPAVQCSCGGAPHDQLPWCCHLHLAACTCAHPQTAAARSCSCG